MSASRVQSGLTPVVEALNQLLDSVTPITEIEEVSLKDALNRVLGKDQVSLVNVPPADNSAMDGYAVRLADFETADSDGVTTLPVSQRIAAGRAPSALKPKSVARIFTGAEVPEGADAIVMQENAEVTQDQVRFAIKPTLQAHVRPQGQDIQKGAVVVAKGKRLRAQDLGLLASVGIATIPVYRRLRVAILSTGDELIDPGNPLEKGQIYNSNRYTLTGLVTGMGCELVDLGIVKDAAEATESALLQGAERADCIISCGGVSVGEEDYVKSAIEKLGSLRLWKLAIKPGKPLAYGDVRGTPFIGLPGNPAAVFVTYCIIARPYLLKMQGVDQWLPTPLKVKAGFTVAKPSNRQVYLRARIQLNAAGEAQVEIYPNQSSGVLASAAWGDGFALLPVGSTVELGDMINFITYDSVLK
ncbi:MAG: molybdopterin molybdotransferase MoeA [Pseudomonadales bacterium]|nr:molybdopterin molybdotransferase MoeA [Pseudomonadales bacterium]